MQRALRCSFADEVHGTFYIYETSVKAAASSLNKNKNVPLFCDNADRWGLVMMPEKI